METNIIYNEDCLETLKRMEDNSIDLVVTSPPYNKGIHPRNGTNGFWSAYSKKIEYDSYADALPQDEYDQWQSKVLSECMRVIKPSGSIFYNHKEWLADGLAVFPKFVFDFPLHQTLIWDRGGSCANDPHQFQNQNEFIFWIVKSPKETYFDKSQSGFRQTIWRVNPEHNSNHPAPFPVKLIKSIIASASPEDGVVYDPFMGSGTTAVATIQVGGEKVFRFGNIIQIS